jgi:acetylornithine deacetylase/succinyl-diaminopimelate desuccinylase-like protein
MSLNKIHEHIDSNMNTYIQELMNLVAYPSVSSQKEEVRSCGLYLNELMNEIGFQSSLYETNGNPIVFGTLQGDSHQGPTILFYGHYDVQPPDPLEDWQSPPFKPEIRNGRIYGRGTGDNKGQFLCHLLAIKSYMETHGSLPITVKVILDGEEEIGSPSLLGFVQDNEKMLKADVVLTSDGPIHDSGSPMVVFGVRGVMNFELILETGKIDNHSGNKGGIIKNAAWEMVNLLSTMKDDEGNVVIEGFYDDVFKPTDYDMTLIDALPFNPDSMAEVCQVKSIDLDKRTFFERLMFWPTLTINGLNSGHIGPGTKNIVPHKAVAKMEVRLVLDQDPVDILRKVENHVKRSHAMVQVVSQEEDMRPSRTSAELEVSKAVVEAVAKGFGEKPIVMPSMGGSLPDFVWTKGLGVPSIMIPYANADEANHAPNENMSIECFNKGIHASAQIIYELSKLTEKID